jgi:hypothetical protein
MELRSHFGGLADNGFELFVGLVSKRAFLFLRKKSNMSYLFAGLLTFAALVTVVPLVGTLTVLLLVSRTIPRSRLGVIPFAHSELL